jgi:carboxyl-terminal processing protease
VAAALLDAGRAKLVGEHTFGRAAVSKTVPLPEGGLVLTVAKYMSPKGTSIHGQGLAPTVPVAQEDEDEAAEGAARPDRILEKALEVVKGSQGGEKAAAKRLSASGDGLQALPGEKRGQRRAGPSSPPV